MTEEKLENLIISMKENKIDKRVVEEVNNIFFSTNPPLPKKYDAILVLASSSIKRIKFAISLYQKKNVKLIISGGTYLENKQLLEAEMFYIYAICHGVDEKDIILELQSKNTYENFIYSLDLIKKMKTIRNIVVITNANHMPRAIRTGQKIIQEQNLDYILHEQKSTLSSIQKNNWQKNEKAIEILIGELEKLIKYNLIKK